MCVINNININVMCNMCNGNISNINNENINIK